jgi:hypothetical protein
MNYPVPTPDPKQNAKFLDNRRLNKFITEYQQMINVAIAFHGGEREQFLIRKNNLPYGSKSHFNHPCTIWARHNRSNFMHMVKSTLEFYLEHKERGGKGHENVPQNIKKATDFSLNIPQGELTSFPNCTVASKYDINFKHIGDVHLAYKLYLNARWDNDSTEPQWTY